MGAEGTERITEGAAGSAVTGICAVVKAGESVLGSVKCRAVVKR